MTQRLPQRTMDSTRPTPGMVSPRAAIRIPSGPSRTAVPSRTSTTVQPGIVAGLVSGAATSGCRIAIAGAECPHWPGASGVHRPATGRVAWECCRQWRANPAPTPSFARLQPCGLIALRKSAARALLSAQRPRRLSSLANCGQFRPPAHPNPKLATIAAVTSTAARARSPNGSRTTSTASRSDFRKFHRRAGCCDRWRRTTLPDQISKVLGSRYCMA